MLASVISVVAAMQCIFHRGRFPLMEPAAQGVNAVHSFHNVKIQCANGKLIADVLSVVQLSALQVPPSRLLPLHLLQRR